MKRVASLNLIASDCGVFSSISSHAARARDPRFVGPDSSERALFRDWRGALLREEIANRRDALRRRQAWTDRSGQARTCGRGQTPCLVHATA